jgi:hypothetical protein
MIDLAAAVQARESNEPPLLHSFDDFRSHLLETVDRVLSRINTRGYSQQP